MLQDKINNLKTTLKILQLSIKITLFTPLSHEKTIQINRENNRIVRYRSYQEVKVCVFGSEIHRVSILYAISSLMWTC